jgi:hypothetical protein
MYKRILVAVSAGVFLAMSASQATAAPILMTWSSPGNHNDCAGLFGGKKGVVCDVGNYLDPATAVSPWIAKYDTGTTDWEVNSAYGSITGSEFTINGGGSGSWSYLPGSGDPGVRFWVAKGGNQGFRLHWMVESTTVGTTCDTAYTLNCLNLALAVTSGTWSTPSTQGLSHMTFYNGGPSTSVPEPATLLLLGVGGAAAIVRRRRR